MISRAPNINILWARLIVEELVRNGVESFCVAPGSRSAPLAVAVAEHPQAKAVVHFDERGLAFHALGISAATKQPTAIISTSGTAAANLFPAIIEASKKKLPLIILTADRPPELRATGANQTIDQNKMFADYVRFYFDFPCPTTEITPAMVLTTVDQAVFRSRGEVPGPVHLNCMFREPLAPVGPLMNFASYLRPLKQWQKSQRPYTTHIKTSNTLASIEINAIADHIRSIQNGLIVVGKTSGRKDEEAILKLAAKLQWPVYADITSGLRLGYDDPRVITHLNQLLGLSQLHNRLNFDGVLHVGGRITSQNFYKFIQRLQPPKYLMAINHPLRNDPQHQVTLRIQSTAQDLCESLLTRVPRRSANPTLKLLQTQNAKYAQFLDTQLSRSLQTLNEPLLARTLSKLMPADSALFIANSMPIRDLDLYAAPRTGYIHVSANRGASGIDGNIASACGFAKGLNKPCTALIGDLAFLHDLNSLALVKELAQPFVLIVINNNGGAIFSFLPIAQYKKGFEKFFVAPHGLSFESHAKAFGLAYQQITSIAHFQAEYPRAIKHDQATILELRTQRPDNLQIHQSLAVKKP